MTHFWKSLIKWGCLQKDCPDDQPFTCYPIAVNPTVKQFVLATTSAVLYVLSFAPFNFGYLQLFWAIPLFFAIQSHASMRQRLTLGTWVGTLIGFGGFYWVAHAVSTYGELPYAIGLLVLTLFCVSGQIHIPLAFFIEKEIPKKLRNPLTFAVLFTGLECLWPKLFKDLSGNAFSSIPILAQAADIGGVPGLSLLAMLVNRSLFEKKWIMAVTALALWSGYGIYTLKKVRSLDEEKSVKIALIQANIGDPLKVAAEQNQGSSAYHTVISRYAQLTQKTIEESKPDWVIWPETAVPGLYNDPRNILPELQIRWNTRMLVGGYDRDAFGTDYNALFIHSRNSSAIEGVYRKSVLLQFGETLPFAETFPQLKGLFQNMGFFGAGPGGEVFEIDGIRIAPTICYEALLPDLMVKAHQYRPFHLMVNVTNDSWFGQYGEPYLHLALAQMRSIETRTPLVRATNTGITAWVDRTGEVRNSTIVQETKAHVIQVPILRDTQHTFFLNGGYHLKSILMLIATVLGIFALSMRRKHSKS